MSDASGNSEGVPFFIFVRVYIHIITVLKLYV